MTATTETFKAGQIVTVNGWDGTSLITAVSPWGGVEVNIGYYEGLPLTDLGRVVRTLSARELPEGAVVYAGDTTWLKDVIQPGRLAWTGSNGDQATDDDVAALLAAGAEIFRVDWESGQW